jgi:hypothetical protein
MTLDLLQTRLLRVSVVGLLMVTPFATAVRAQETTGTIFGTVRDQAGAVVPDAKVIITNVDTRQTREAVPNRVGQYTVALPVGTYEVRFLLPNSQPFIVNAVSVHVNDRWQIDGDLTIGLVETLNVTATRSVQRTSAVQGLIPPVAIRELPILNRTLVQFVTLVPGVSSDLREDACFCDQGNLDISMNGGRRSAVNWLLDGASNVNTWNNYTLVTTPSLETIQEINVITSTYSAEWSRNGGGVVNAVTKSGGQRFSGSAYEFLRNDGLNANSFFRNMDPNPSINGSPRRLRYNNFGYTFGGPALPTRKNLFFFFSEELRRSSRDKQQVEGLVPDPAWLTNPASPNYVPPEARDPNAVKLLTLWPSPNVPGTNRYRTTITNRLDTRQEFVRADYGMSADWSLKGRYLHDWADSRGEYWTFPDMAPGRRYRRGQLAIVEARRAGGRVLHELVYQQSNHEQMRVGAPRTREDLGLQMPEIFPENKANLIPRFFVSGVTSSELSESVSSRHLSHTFSSAHTVQHDTHTLKAGGLIGFERATSNLFVEETQGTFIFFSGGGFTGFQNFLRGNPDGRCGARCSYRETEIDVLNRLRSRRYELYVQDTWRIHPKVTLDLGLRYAFYPPVTDAGDMLFTFSPDAYDPTRAPAFDPSGRLLMVGTGDLSNGMRVAGKNSPYGHAIYEADTNNLQPRVGAAWDPGGAGRLVVRAGYGMYFDQNPLERFAYSTQEPRFNPFRNEVMLSNPALSDPTKGSVVQPATVSPAYALGISDRFVAPRWQHWNVGVQRRLYSGGVIDIGWVGSRGDHLLRYVDINQPQPADLLGLGNRPNTVRPFVGYSSIFMQETTGKSRYQGLLAAFRHEAGRAGSVTVNYTLSRNKADATYDFGGGDDPQNPLNKEAEFAAAGTDRTHIFNAFYIYELPFAREGDSRWRRALLGGWQIAGVTWIESGPAARVEVVNFNYEGGFFPSHLRPDQIGDPGAGDQAGLLWFDPAAFVPSPAGEYGTARVAPFRLPGRHQWDFAISKVVGIAGNRRLQFRADLINAFNHTQFLDVDTSCVGTTTCGSSFGTVTSTRPAREIQLGIRFDW